MFGIKNYSPEIYTSPSNIVKDHRNNLEGLIGKNIKEIWVAWEQTSNEWFKDCPVIICFEDCQVELCAYKSNEYAVSFNQIRVSQGLDWYGTDLKLSWEKNKVEELNFAIGKRVNGIEIIERCEENEANYFYLDGIGFQLNDGYFAICNGLDENLIVKKREEGPNYKQTII